MPARSTCWNGSVARRFLDPQHHATRLLIDLSTIAEPALMRGAHRGAADPASGGPGREAERGHMMRTRHLVAGLLAVMLAACSSGTSAAPSAAPSVEPTPQPTPTTAATPAPTASPAPTATTPGLSVKVTFDGETCSYVGPTVIPDGTMLRFEYAPDQEVGGVIPHRLRGQAGDDHRGSRRVPDRRPTYVSRHPRLGATRTTASWIHGSRHDALHRSRA